MVLSKNSLEVLRCPKCRGTVDEKGKFIICNRCNLAFPILARNIPNMLLEDAWRLEKAKAENFRHKLK